MAWWVLGICLEILATLAGTVGKQLIRYSAGEEQDGKELRAVDCEDADAAATSSIQDIEIRAPVEPKVDPDDGAAAATSSVQAIELRAPVEPGAGGGGLNLCCSRAVAFRIGMVVNVFGGPLFELSAYAFASQSLLAPFGGLDTVWNAIAAPYTLGEELTRQRLTGVCIIVVGTICSALFAKHEESTFTVESLKDILLTWRTGYYVIVFNLWFGLNIGVICTFPKGSFQRGLSLGVMGGTLAGNMWCVKATMALISASFSQGFGVVFGDWLPYATIGAAVVIAVTNVIFLTKGMQENEALFMVRCVRLSILSLLHAWVHHLIVILYPASIRNP